MGNTRQPVGIVPLSATDNTRKIRNVNRLRIKTWIRDTLAMDAEIVHAAENDAAFQTLLASFDDDEQANPLLQSRFLSLLNQVFDDRSRAEIALDE